MIIRPGANRQSLATRSNLIGSGMRPDACVIGSTDYRAQPELKRMPLNQITLKAPRPEAYFDADIFPNPKRVLEMVEAEEPKVDELMSMGHLYLGALRTFTGNLAHENGWLASFKSHQLLHWQGIAQRALLIRTESDYRFIRCGTECLRVVTSDGYEVFDYTGDVLLVLPGGSWVVIEVKRDENDLKDPAYRRKLAAVAEVLRRLGIGFQILFRNEIFAGRRHRINAELFASRAFVTVTQWHIDRLETLALRQGTTSTIEEVAEALEPGSPVQGAGVMMALAVRRRIDIDLKALLRPSTPLTIF